MPLRLLLPALLLLFFAPSAPATEASAIGALQVVLVRHAEKSAEPADDPGLNEAGRQRALALAEALRHAGVRHIVVSSYARTQETAAPLAALLDIVPQVAAPGIDLDAHVRGVAALVHAADGPVLVVGHSNTVPAIILALGGPAVSPIGDDDYDRLYVFGSRDSGPALVQARYGD
jgi:broad specificity phosphatase PhoE